MKKPLVLTVMLVFPSLFIPGILKAESAAGEIRSMQMVLDQVYNEMIPLCSRLISVGRGIAGFAALWYIASRVWRSIAAAEPIDMYPLLRPFALGLAILLFPSVLSLMNAVLQPTVSATGAMVAGSDKAIAVLLKQKEKAIMKSDVWEMYVGQTGEGDRDKWYKYSHPEGEDGEGLLESIGNDVKFAMAKASYSFRNSIKQWMSEVLQLVYAAAALCINTIRTFYLIILAILGPLVFGFAVFDGFQHTLTVWIARYVNVFLWLPVANIFGSIAGKIQENMIKIDLAQIGESGDTFFSSTDSGYLIFLIIGTVGYFTVPNVAGYIVHAGGGNALLQKVSAIVASSGNMTVSAGQSAVSYAAGGAGNMLNAGAQIFPGSGAARSGSGGNHEAESRGYMQDKLSGK